jgi:hypothetical protein
MAEIPVTLSAASMSRLTLVRYLYEGGVEQSRRQTPLSGLAILQLHDAAEFFLQAAVEHKGVILDRSTDFMSYWPAMERAGIKLGRQETMRRLNRARVMLKHDGTLPAHQSVDDFREKVGAFLEENFQPIFGIRLADVSLSSLVKSETIRTLLRASEQSFNSANYPEAVAGAARAFKLVLQTYASTSGDLIAPGVRLSPFLGFGRLHFSDDGSPFSPGMDRELKNALEEMSTTFSEQITVLAYHLDFDGYRFLKSYGPAIYDMGDGQQQHIQWRADASSLTEQIAARCIEFATDAALRLEGRGSSVWGTP